MTDITKVDWIAKAETLSINAKALIDGKFVDAVSGKTFASTSPIDGRHLADVAHCGTHDVDLAVAAGRRAFADGRWAHQSPSDRKLVLRRLATLIRENRDELALLETLDMGKPIADSTSIDVRAVANCFDWYGEAIDKIYDEVAPTARNTLALVTKEPLGVVAAVVPWNFPMLMASWKVAPALAMGNSVVLKPAEQSSLSAIRLAELALEAGVPAGVFNVVTGDGPEVGQALGLHMDVDGLFFTGSTQVGKYFMEYSAKSNLKRLGLELGGKSPNIILSSYHATKHAAETSAHSAFFNQGEMCTCPSRLIVERSVHEEVVETLIEVAKSYQPNNPLLPETTMGAIVDERHTNRVMEFVDYAKEDGARVATGGIRVRQDSGGCYIEPTIYDNATNSMRIAQEEIFGPMLTVIPVDSVDEAIEAANDSCYGLASAVWTDDLTTAHKVSSSIRAGLVYVNCYDCDDMTTPFGGFKQSGIGRDKSLHALDKYVELKTTWMNVGGAR
ncbi:aldehyde dehydrogenase [Pacificibacter marinus]|uniref:Aldehyde dehydrogenase PuuC n=1 Tax=Pacificibacter marinus TaxID=658057 RepID=A0A1Y5R6D0_9RHOB|nr:aldehyde dehydrogenase [Pacificibacter marinus]SEK29738.1 gamma-glutamyl-gamma-aminobutyraldehyde dehydrogenase [Pacificibacter marinus]SLN10253.1 Aldehyde dehydrogenase PuuC [Pacificibacter marinus]